MPAASFPVTSDHVGFHTLYTAGHGNKSPEDFLSFLAGIGMTHLLDVRRPSKSWHPDYTAGSGLPILSVNHHITYLWYPNLGKPKQMSLEDYSTSLKDFRKHHFQRLVNHVQDVGLQAGKPCLLCAEGKPFEKDNKTPRCHRVILATALAKMLGSNLWTISHLIM